MTRPDANDDVRELWRNEFGASAERVWDAFRFTAPPTGAPAPAAARSPRWHWLGLAASWVMIAVLLAWNAELRRDLVGARQHAALVLLAAERSDRVLSGLADARQLRRDPDIRAALLELLARSRDPNVQLEALDMLLDDEAADPASRRRMLDAVRFNREFIESALQSRETRI